MLATGADIAFHRRESLLLTEGGTLMQVGRDSFGAYGAPCELRC